MRSALKPLYELAVLGAPSDTVTDELQACLAAAVSKFGMRLGHEIGWKVKPSAFMPSESNSAAAVFFGALDAPVANLEALLRRNIPILPVASRSDQVTAEIPAMLKKLNCLDYSHFGVESTAMALLECAGLLARQRRVFVSYRRDEARQAALQIFDALSARLFDVFLDTHGIAPGTDFQPMLWHRLCDSDVLLMLDTPNYFGSRWTSAEFGRALAKGISVLRVGWPDATPSIRTATASRVELVPHEVDTATGRLADDALSRICLQIEAVRSQSQAVRALNLASSVRTAVEQIGGVVAGVGLNKAIYVSLPDGRDVAVYPTLGVPTSSTLHDAVTNSRGGEVAVVYDSVGLLPNWIMHLDWLGDHIHNARWLKASEAAWQLAAWED